MVIKLGFAAHISVNFGGQPDPEKWTLSTMDSKHHASLTTFFEVALWRNKVQCKKTMTIIDIVTSPMNPNYWSWKPN